MLDSYIFFEDQYSSATRYYTSPIELIIAKEPHEVPKAFKAIQSALSAGYHVAGNFSYELGYVLESHLLHLLPENRNFPLINIGVFNGFNSDQTPILTGDSELTGKFIPDWTFSRYKKAFDQVLSHIYSGEVYQVNLTFPMRCKTKEDPVSLFKRLCLKQPVKYAGIVSLGDPVILSFSPELFFQQANSKITMRPMKGTIQRGENSIDDARLANEMKADIKSQAENLMIVDLIRNDLSRVSEVGSVKVTQLYCVESYPTLHQMTSTIISKLNSGLGVDKLFKSLFPCGSVTGAPKIRAMELIKGLESCPRDAYCGAIGYIEPSGLACFNVAIRSISMFSDGSAVYNTGSAIVSDSCPYKEYDECILKAKFLN